MIPLHKIDDEAIDAQEKYGNFASMHEAYGVLIEEVQELFEAIRMKQNDGNRPFMIEHEAIQVGAVALRIAQQAHIVKR